jgi:outer membrane protein assembly factor BamB
MHRLVARFAFVRHFLRRLAMSRYAALLWASLTAAVAHGADAPWPQFRGPGGSGVAEGASPPVEIGLEKNLKWKTAVPPGLSSPIAVADLLVLTAFEDGKLLTIAYRRADGSEAWRAEAPAKELEAFHKTEGSPAASTPVTDGERIVSYFGSCGLFCYDLAGKELWRYELPPAKMFGNFGSGVSPVLADNVVVLLRDEANDPKILAVDADTGDLVWEKKRKSKAGYCTPAVWDTPDGKQVAAPGNERMIGYDLATGEEKWHVLGMPAASCASPVTAGDDLYFAAWSPGAADDKENQMPTFDQLLQSEAGDADGDGALSKAEVEKSPLRDFFDNNDENHDGLLTRNEWDVMLAYMAGSKNSAFALRPGGAGDVTKSHVRWLKSRGLPYVASAILYEGQFVMVKDGGIVTAYDADSGEEIYQKRAAASGSYYASPVAADGHIYFTSLADGAITVIEAGGDAPKVAVQNEPLGERVAATPAIADDALYVRTAENLYAFGKKD